MPSVGCGTIIICAQALDSNSAESFALPPTLIPFRVIMSSKTVGSPTLTFKAGGRSPSPGKKPSESPTKNNTLPVSSSSPRVKSSVKTNIPLPLPLSVIQTGLASKRSPFQIKNWIACVLTLDGRDKFTKVLQYTSRLLCWYFAALAMKSNTGTSNINSIDTSSTIAGMTSLLSAVYSNAEIRKQYYLALSKRFDVLYKSLVTSRKAFRLGRSVIEMDKIASMGWGEYLGYMLLHPLAGGVAGQQESTSYIEKELVGKEEHANTLLRHDTHPIQEGENEEDESSWNGDEQSDDEDSLGEEKKLDIPNPTSAKKKVVSRPGRPKLPTKLSSNIGWGPSTTTASASTETESASKSSTTKKPPPRTVSEMGRQMYTAFPSRSSSMGSFKQLKDSPATLQTQLIQPPATPAWKLIGGTMKLLGLMGFWAFDNVSFLTGSGFLDPISSGVGDKMVLVDPKAGDRLKRKNGACEWGGRFYFAGSIGGLYVNARALWEHNAKLSEAQVKLDKASTEDDIKEAQAYLQQSKRKHFELSLALLKSCCDFMVFSNNPGIDLHLKYRGKKNHEGLHCLGGLISASTVLYSNFPNATK